MSNTGKNHYRFHFCYSNPSKHIRHETKDPRKLQVQPGVLQVFWGLVVNKWKYSYSLRLFTTYRICVGWEKCTKEQRSQSRVAWTLDLRAVHYSLDRLQPGYGTAVFSQYGTPQITLLWTLFLFLLKEKGHILQTKARHIKYDIYSSSSKHFFWLKVSTLLGKIAFPTEVCPRCR